LADRAKQQAESANTESVKIFVAASAIVLPTVDVDKLKDEAQSIKQEVELIYCYFW
jgi:hypothetical protein